MTIEEEFEELVQHNHKVYRSKDPEIRQFLKDRKKMVRKLNKNLKPEISNHQWKCLTCGTKDKSHPDNGFCFVCDTDNWENISNE